LPVAYKDVGRVVASKILSLAQILNIQTPKVSTQQSIKLTHTPLKITTLPFLPKTLLRDSQRSVARYEKLFREEIKDGAIYLDLKDPSIKKTDRMINANILPAPLHT
jgi:hypothetical protein